MVREKAGGFFLGRGSGEKRTRSGKGAARKSLTVAKEPAALVVKLSMRDWTSVASGSPDEKIPALLTRTSTRPCFTSTSLAAAAMESYFETSIWVNSTVPGRF